MLGIVHAGCGILGLVVGAQILLARKGTTMHVRVGYAYAISMLGLNLSGLSIYHLTGGFNQFHVLALISLATIIIGLVQPIYCRNSPKWLWRHYQYMSWSYVALLAATNNEAFVRIAPLKQLTLNTTPALPILVMVPLMLACAFVIFSRQRPMLAYYGQATPGERRIKQ